MDEPKHPRPDKCPECGASATKDDSRYFDCESYWLFVPGHLNQSYFCEVQVLRANYAALLAERDRLQGQVDRLIDKCVKPCEGGYFILVGDNHGMYPNQAAAVAALLEENK